MLKEIQIKNLYKKYNNNSVFSLQNIDFNIKNNSIHGILGSNGAGKTTLIKIFCDVIKSSSGDIYFYDENDKIIPKKEIKKIIGYVPQDFAFYDDLTIWQNFLFFGTMYNIEINNIKKEYNELIPFLKLEEHKDKKVKYFSGGMKRKVNLALGLLHNPELIILDEPTVGIDIKSKAEILNHLHNLNKKGKTIIYTSHQMDEAENFCSHVSLFNNGKLIVNGETKKVLLENNMNNLEQFLLTL